MKPRMNTDKHGWVGGAGRLLSVVGGNGTRGAHGVTRPTSHCAFLICVRLCPSVAKT
jgi:hypothetical protein